MPATPYDDQGSSGWDARGDAYDSQTSLPGLPVAAGGPTGRSDPFRWHPSEVASGSGPVQADEAGTDAWSRGQSGDPSWPGGQASDASFPVGYSGENSQRSAAQARHRGTPPPEDPRRAPEFQGGREQYPDAEPGRAGYEPAGQPRSGPSHGGRGHPDPLADEHGPDAGAPEPGAHPDWAGDDQHPGFFRGFGDDEGVDPPRRKRGRWAAPLIALVVILVVVGSVGTFVVRSYEASHANYSGSGTGKVIVLVKAGDSATSLAPKLVSLGVIKAPGPFIAAAKDSATAGDLTPGTVGMHKHMNAALAWARLVNPNARIQTTISIPDGERKTAIIASLAKQAGKPLGDFQKALADTAALGLPSFAHGNPEGYLFPATYIFPPGTTPLKMLQTMVAKFNSEAASLNLSQQAKQGQLSETEVIIQASILEAEADPGDYAKVARVIDNRLNHVPPMKLQDDSTVLYALGITGFNLTHKQLYFNSPYNTFVHTGLPPGPIDSPGVAAITAALHPAKGNWLYFVTIDPKSGLTKFTNSYQQFLTWSKESDQNIKNGT